MGQGLLIHSGDSPWTRLNCASCSPCFPAPLHPLGGCSRVGGQGWWEGLFTQGSGRTPNCSACDLPSISSCLSQSPPACSCPASSAAHPTLLFPAPGPCRLPGDLFCFLLCFFFCFECLSLQVSVAGRSPFRSQRLQCKFPSPLGKCTTLFWGVLGCFFVFLFFCFVLFFSFAFFSLLFGGNGRKWEQGGGRWILFIFLAHFQGVGIFF